LGFSFSASLPLSPVPPLGVGVCIAPLDIFTVPPLGDGVGIAPLNILLLAVAHR